MVDHDQRFKVLLCEFVAEFMQLFFPEWAERFDLSQIVWQDKEAFLDPPQGERRFLDLVARVPVRVAPHAGTAEAETWLILLHLEIEAEDAVATLRRRMFDYWHTLRMRHGLPVLSIGFYLRVGLEGLGWDVYEESFWGRPQVRFEYPYVGLPALDGEEYLRRENVLGMALLGLMRLPEERRLELGRQAWRRLLQSGENEQRRYLLCECLDAYLPRNDEQRQRFEEQLRTTAAEGEKAVIVTMFDRIRQEGREAERRDLLLMQLETRFGPLSEHVRLQVAQLPAERLRELLRGILSAQSLGELGLFE